MNPAARLYAWAALGSALGGLARYLVSAGWYQWLGASFPWPTMAVNVAGSALVGLYFALTLPEGRLMARPGHRVFVIVGFCGGFTTFSIFSLESLVLFDQGRLAALGAYLLLSVTGWIAAVWLGYAWGTVLNRMKRKTSP